MDADCACRGENVNQVHEQKQESFVLLQAVENPLWHSKPGDVLANIGSLSLEGCKQLGTQIVSV